MLSFKYYLLPSRASLCLLEFVGTRDLKHQQLTASFQIWKTNSMLCLKNTVRSHSHPRYELMFSLLPALWNTVVLLRIHQRGCGSLSPLFSCVFQHRDHKTQLHKAGFCHNLPVIWPFFNSGNMQHHLFLAWQTQTSELELREVCVQRAVVGVRRPAGWEHLFYQENSSRIWQACACNDWAAQKWVQNMGGWCGEMEIYSHVSNTSVFRISNKKKNQILAKSW